MKTIRGGGFQLLTDDPVIIAVVRRCEELSKENAALREMLTERDQARVIVERARRLMESRARRLKAKAR